MSFFDSYVLALRKAVEYASRRDVYGELSLSSTFPEDAVGCAKSALTLLEEQSVRPNIIEFWEPEDLAELHGARDTLREVVANVGYRETILIRLAFGKEANALTALVRDPLASGLTLSLRNTVNSFLLSRDELLALEAREYLNKLSDHFHSESSLEKVSPHPATIIRTPGANDSDVVEHYLNMLKTWESLAGDLFVHEEFFLDD